MRRAAVLLVVLGLAAAEASALPRKAVELASSIVELEQRIAERRRSLPGEAEDLASRLSQLAKLVPEDRLDLEPELVAFLETGYAFLFRAGPRLPVRAAESELRYRALLGGEEREFVRKEIGGTTVVLRGDPSSREIALTFDDGPCLGDGRSSGTAAVLEVLKEENARGSFFLCGGSALSYPALTRRILAEGHSIGNHTQSHARGRGLAELSDRQIADEIDCGENQILSALGTDEPLILFRCPYGSGVKSSRVNQILAQKGFYNIYWSIDTRDWDTHKRSTTVRRVLNSGQLNGAIVLFHERVPETAQAVRQIIRTLRPRGYRFVSIAQLLGVDNEAPVRLAFREAAGLYMSGDKSAAMHQFVQLAAKEPDSVLADDALHYAWLIALELSDPVSAGKIRGVLTQRYPRSLFTGVPVKLAEPPAAHIEGRSE